VTAIDFIELRDAFHNEIVRRGITPPSDAYIVNPIAGVNILVEHVQKIFTDCKVLDSTKTWSVSSGSIVEGDDLKATVEYVKSLMNQNVKK
jgi:hypothetical protein